MRAFERLRGLVQGGEAVAFVGAGASAGLYPLWAALIHRLADEAVSRGRSNDADRASWLRMRDAYPDQVVRSIKAALSDGIYAEVLREIFRPRAGAGGSYFTDLHAVLLRLPFKGYITTNFDAGLVEARMAHRKSRATGFATWRDADTVRRWETGDIFKDDPCPVLFAHGIYDRSDTVVLGTAEYRDAYKSGPFRRLFDSLWSQSHLVFVGFSFSDDWVKFIANEVLTTGGKRTSEPRHVALIGLREAEPYAPFMRDLFVDQYDAEPLFYPIAKRADGSEDHSALRAILDELAGSAPPSPPPGPTPPPAPVPPTIVHRWVHETTEDTLFTGRTDALAKLDRWSADPQVRVIGVTGMGGIGKTSLIGRWLRKGGGDRRRPYAGLFFWSFYAESDVAAFAKAFVEFSVKELGTPAPPENKDPGEAALEMLRAKPVLLVLDGLEVVQELPGTAGYGELLEDDLRALLVGAFRLRHAGLVVLTSRFPFADLSPYLGNGFRSLDLDSLAPAEGAALLVACDVGGTEADREAVSRRLDGHPLGLRLFALTLAKEAKGDPTGLVEEVFASEGLSDADPLERKMKRLLGFYEKKLPRDRVALLGLVSLFRSPAPEATILTLARGLPTVAAALSGASDAALRGTLSAMAREHLLIRDAADGGATTWSCHPVLRDHFRRTLLGWDTTIGAEAAGLLAGQPASERPSDVRALQPVLAAIELLLDAGDFVGADRLYRERLDNGGIFKWLPAPAEGMRCALGFVRDSERCRRFEQALSRNHLGFMMNEVGLHAVNAGEFAFAQPFWRDGIAMRREDSDKHHLSIHLQNDSSLLALLGRLADAEASAREALFLACATEDQLGRRIWASLSELGEALTGQGRTSEALAAFDAANTIKRRMDLDGDELYSLAGVRWASLLLRVDRTARAQALTEANLRICERNSWREDVARCHRLLGAIATATQDFAAAARHLGDAETIVRRGHLITELPKVLLARGDLERRRRHFDAADVAVEEALRLAAPRRMRLDHADALVLRARISLDRARTEPAEAQRAAAERASDDLEDALKLARECGYAWAARDALALLAEVSDTLGRAGDAVTFRREAEVLSRCLADTTPP